MQVAVAVHNDVVKDARVLKEAATLVSAGHEVTVFGLHDEESGEQRLAGGIRLVISRRDKSAVAARVKRIEKPTKEDRVRASFDVQGAILANAILQTMIPDVIHIHDHVALTGAKLLKEVTGVPIVWDAHEIYEDLAGIADARAVVNPQVISEFTPYVDHFVTINESIAEFYSGKYQNLADATILPNSRRHELVPDYDGRLHDAAGLPQTQKILLFQGGFSNHRGIPALLEAGAHLPSGWSVVFMGWGTLADEIASHDQDVDNDGVRRIIAVPGVPNGELLSWTAGATVGVIPYEDKGLNHLYCTPNKLWEYPLAGVPIIGTNFPEMAKVITGRGVGWVIPQEFTANDIAEVVNSLTEEKISAAREHSSKFVQNDNWTIHEQRLVDLYQKIGEATKFSWQTHDEFIESLT